MSDSLSLKSLPSGIPAREVSNFSVNGSLQIAKPWGSLAARTALRVVVLSTDRLIDHRSPLGAHDTTVRRASEVATVGRLAARAAAEVRRGVGEAGAAVVTDRRHKAVRAAVRPTVLLPEPSHVIGLVGLSASQGSVSLLG